MCFYASETLARLWPYKGSEVNPFDVQAKDVVWFRL